MNPDADPKLVGLFAEPIRDLRDDERALQGLLAQLERTDRRRGLILTVAGAVGAALALVIIAMTGVSVVARRLLEAVAGWDVASLTLPSVTLPSTVSASLQSDGPAIGVALGVAALCACAAYQWIRTRT